jgi:hypothetical protein
LLSAFKTSIATNNHGRSASQSRNSLPVRCSPKIARRGLACQPPLLHRNKQDEPPNLAQFEESRAARILVGIQRVAKKGPSSRIDRIFDPSGLVSGQRPEEAHELRFSTCRDPESIQKPPTQRPDSNRQLEEILQNRVPGFAGDRGCVCHEICESSVLFRGCSRLHVRVEGGFFSCVVSPRDVVSRRGKPATDSDWLSRGR